MKSIDTNYAKILIRLIFWKLFLNVLTTHWQLHEEQFWNCLYFNLTQVWYFFTLMFSVLYITLKLFAIFFKSFNSIMKCCWSWLTFQLGLVRNLLVFLFQFFFIWMNYKICLTNSNTLNSSVVFENKYSRWTFFL